MSRIIEFVGVPCCGKSTLAHYVAKELKYDETQYIYSHIESSTKRIVLKLFCTCVFVLTHPMKSALFIIKGLSPAFFINFAFIKWVCLKKNIVLEQGYCQLVMSFFEQKTLITSKKITEIVDLILPKTDDILVVFVDVSIQNIKNRIKMRKINDLPKFSKNDDIDSNIKSMQYCLNLMEFILKKKKNTAVFHIQNDRALTDTVKKQILDSIKKMI